MRTRSSTKYRPPQTTLFRLLPTKLIPYAELMRLDRPAGFYGFYWHFAIGLSFAACLTARGDAMIPPGSLLGLAAYLACWVLLLRGTVCTINDNFDQDFDRKVARTRNRPIARGAVSTSQANTFAALQLVVLSLMSLPFRLETRFYAGLVTFVLSVYPLAKRVTYYPQLILGYGLALSIFLCCAEIGVDPIFQKTVSSSYNVDAQNKAIWATLCVYSFNAIWNVIFDTIYAHQDILDDRRIGMKGLAVLMGDWTKPICGVLATIQVAFLIYAGRLAGFSFPFYTLGCGGAALSMFSMLVKVDLNRPDSCAWWFGPGSQPVGISVTLGLLTQYFSELQRFHSPENRFQ